MRLGEREVLACGIDLFHAGVACVFQLLVVVSVLLDDSDRALQEGDLCLVFYPLEVHSVDLDVA